MRTLIDRHRAKIRPASCPLRGIACAAAQRRGRLLRRSLPLAMFAVPTVVTAYGFVIPGSCIAGFNALTVGFATTVLARACRTPLGSGRRSGADGRELKRGDLTLV